MLTVFLWCGLRLLSVGDDCVEHARLKKKNVGRIGRTFSRRLPSTPLRLTACANPALIADVLRKIRISNLAPSVLSRVVAQKTFVVCEEEAHSSGPFVPFHTLTTHARVVTTRTRKT
jgi:hypothetical protein